MKNGFCLEKGFESIAVGIKSLLGYLVMCKVKSFGLVIFMKDTIIITLMANLTLYVSNVILKNII